MSSPRNLRRSYRQKSAVIAHAMACGELIMAGFQPDAGCILHPPAGDMPVFRLHRCPNTRAASPAQEWITHIRVEAEAECAATPRRPVPFLTMHQIGAAIYEYPVLGIAHFQRQGGRVLISVPAPPRLSGVHQQAKFAAGQALVAAALGILITFLASSPRARRNFCSRARLRH